MMLLALSAMLLAPLAATAALNARTFRRLPPSPPGAPPPRVSVLVPARNEALRIAPLLDSFLALPPDEAAELVVYDDASTDATAEIVGLAVARDARVRLIHGAGPPPGWAGKIYGMHRLVEAAAPENDLVLFIDADVTLIPGGIARAAAAMRAEGLDVLSVYPEQVLGTTAERAFVPMMVQWFYMLGPQWLHARGAQVPVVPLNGQFLLWRRDRLAALGGWEAIRGAWLDDMAMGRHVAAHGFRGRYRAGMGIARCRMYVGFKDAWEGFARHAYDGMGLAPLPYLALHAWLFGALVLPWLAAVAWAWRPPTAAEGAVFGAIVAMTAFVRLVAIAQTGHGWLSALLHPVSAAVAIANDLWALALVRRRAVEWKGRMRAT